MDPEVSPMSVARHLASPGLARIFPKILADHGLRDCLDHARIGVGAKSCGSKPMPFWMLKRVSSSEAKDETDDFRL